MRGVEFDRQRHQGEKRVARVKQYADCENHASEGFDRREASDEKAYHYENGAVARGEIGDRHERGAKFDEGVVLGVLYGVADFVRRNAYGRNGI